VYGADEAEATAIVVKLQTQAEAAAAKAKEETPETLADRQKRLADEKAFRETYGAGTIDTSVATAIGG